MTALQACVGLIKNVPHDLVLELLVTSWWHSRFWEAWEVYPCWRKYVTSPEAGFECGYVCLTSCMCLLLHAHGKALSLHFCCKNCEDSSSCQIRVAFYFLFSELLQRCLWLETSLVMVDFMQLSSLWQIYSSWREGHIS